MFGYRHRVTAADLAAHSGCGENAMKLAVTGSRGLLGSALLPFLSAGGHAVARLVRGPGQAAAGFRWDPETGVVDAEAFAGVDAVVHLAGENIAEGRWTAAKKERIRSSRVRGTRTLAEALARLKSPPRVLVCASAIGFYGDRGDAPLDETSSRGDGLLPEVCAAWEAAAAPAAAAGIRVVQLRFGIVLTPKGGALGKMLLPFRLGAGGRLGSGRQWFSWVALDDVLGAIHHAMGDETLRGPVNVTAPGAVTNAEFTRTLAHVLRRPALAPVPAFAARAVFGEMADALLLSSARVRPERLLASGFPFRYPELEGALRHLLGRDAP